jgi:hypothetical protein
LFVTHIWVEFHWVSSRIHTFGVGGGGRQFSIASTLVCSRSCKDEDSLLPLPDPYSLFFLLETALLLLLLSKSGLHKKALLIMPGCCWWRELVLLYLCQPTAEEERKTVRWVLGIVTNLSKLTYTHTGTERERERERA